MSDEVNSAFARRARRSKRSSRPLAEVRAFDDVVNVILDRLSELGWTRGELAARADLNAASLRRLLTSSSANPTFATMMSIAEALGLRIEILEETSVEQMLTAR